MLLGAWGNCPPSGPCAADLNGDGVVNSADSGLLLLSWTGAEFCRIWPVTVDCPSAESFGGTDILINYEFALQFLGFDDQDELADWYATASEAQRHAVLETLTIRLPIPSSRCDVLQAFSRRGAEDRPCSE